MVNCSGSQCTRCCSSSSLGTRRFRSHKLCTERLAEEVTLIRNPTTAVQWSLSPSDGPAQLQRCSSKKKASTEVFLAPFLKRSSLARKRHEKDKNEASHMFLSRSENESGEAINGRRRSEQGIYVDKESAPLVERLFYISGSLSRSVGWLVGVLDFCALLLFGAAASDEIESVFVHPEASNVLWWVCCFAADRATPSVIKTSKSKRTRL